MALIKQNLVNNLLLVFNSETDTFPESLEQAAEQWAAAFNDYAKIVTPPSLTFEAAKQSFKSTFLGITMVNGITQFPQCFINYANALAPGMQPAFSSTPPPPNLNFSPVYALGLSGGSSEQCINMLSNIIHAWMKTGIAVNNSSGATINWA